MKRCVWGVAALAVSLVFTTVAQAAFVGIGKPARGELSHKQIFARAYGGSFRYAGANLTNGTITATRVHDTADQTFGAGTYSGRAIANFSASGQNFGVVQDGEFQRMFGTSGRRMAVGVAAAGTRTFDGPVVFAQKGTRGGHFATAAAANADNYDHAVTYKLTGLDFGGEVYVLFFENRMRGQSDLDYNDLVVELTQTAVAPTPAAAAMGISLLAAATLRRRRRPV